MKDLYKYCFGLAALVLFGLFVYPTLYEFDKLDQRIPVKINRITGSAEILTTNGWIKSGDYDAAADEMRKYRDEIIAKMDSDREQVKQEVISATRDEIISDVQSDLASVKEEITAYKQYEIDPNNSFGIGDSQDTVKRIMGTPDTISDLGSEQWWYYGGSQIVFKDSKVKEWRDTDRNLRLK
jgi:hypothetical protein